MSRVDLSTARRDASHHHFKTLRDVPSRMRLPGLPGLAWQGTLSSWAPPHAQHQPPAATSHRHAGLGVVHAPGRRDLCWSLGRCQEEREALLISGIRPGSPSPHRPWSSPLLQRSHTAVPQLHLHLHLRSVRGSSKMGNKFGKAAADKASQTRSSPGRGPAGHLLLGGGPWWCRSRPLRSPPTPAGGMRQSDSLARGNHREA